MQKTILAVTVILLAHALPFGTANALVGADIADRTVQRYTVVIASQKGRCSGVLMAQDIVLTAAHCIQPGEKSMSVAPSAAGTSRCRRSCSAPSSRPSSIRSTSRPMPARRIWRC